MMAMVGKEHKDEDKKVVVPPVNSVLQPPVDRIEIQLDAQPAARRKALSRHAALKRPRVVPTTRLAFHLPA